ncbi:ankyrin repeat domain-containing protein [Rhodanobacter sp. Col0626]|uniref:ankyrin repeat domain-containing protein n=1 Tax=Rhodanobacter sp. Col0626 TaxID=3415679 RepID=UPI003CF32E7B
MNSTKADQVFADARVAQLATAVGEGDAEGIHALVAAGVDPNAQGDRGVTLPEWALLQQSPKGLTALLDNGADASRPGMGGATVMHMAAMANDPTYLKILLDHGASPDTPHGVTQAPPLDAALMNPDDDAFQLLMAHHADPNRADRLGNTPLHMAAKVHKTRCVLALLEAGADPGRRNQQGATFQTYFNITPAGGLNATARAGHEQVHQWLRQHGVAVESGGP